MHSRAFDIQPDGILRFVDEGNDDNPSNKPGSIPDLRYCVKTAQTGWLPEMVNWVDSGSVGDDYAGNVGQPITYVAMDLDHGWYQVRSEASGWLPRVYQYNICDEEHGCAGDGSPITGIRCGLDHASSEVGAWVVCYQVANVGGGWLSAMHDTFDPSGSGDDYAGNGCRIDRFRASLQYSS